MRKRAANPLRSPKPREAGRATTARGAGRIRSFPRPPATTARWRRVRGGVRQSGSAGRLDGTAASKTCRSGARTTWRVSLAFTQSLYNRRAAAAQEAIAAVAAGSTGSASRRRRAQLLFDVTQAYYDAALSATAVASPRHRSSRRAPPEADAAGFDAGTQPEFEVLRARVTRDNQTPLVIRQRVNREVALLRLKQLLDLPADYALRLADALGDERLAPAPAFAARVSAIEAGMRVTDPVSFPLTVQAGSCRPHGRHRSATTVRCGRPLLRCRSAAPPEREPELAYSRIAYPRHSSRRSTAPTGRSAPPQPAMLTAGSSGATSMPRAELDGPLPAAPVGTGAAQHALAWPSCWRARGVEATRGRCAGGGAYEIADVRIARVSTSWSVDSATASAAGRG